MKAEDIQKLIASTAKLREESQFLLYADFVHVSSCRRSRLLPMSSHEKEFLLSKEFVSALVEAIDKKIQENIKELRSVGVDIK